MGLNTVLSHLKLAQIRISMLRLDSESSPHRPANAYEGYLSSNSHITIVSLKISVSVNYPQIKRLINSLKQTNSMLRDRSRCESFLIRITHYTHDFCNV